MVVTQQHYVSSCFLQVDHGADRETLGEGSCLLEEEGEVWVHEASATEAL